MTNTICTTPQGLSTFGFRGEALSSLCALADVSVITRTADDAVGTRLTFDRQGKLAGREACARGVGTTVAVRELFAPLPVRRQVRQLACTHSVAIAWNMLHAIVCFVAEVCQICWTGTICAALIFQHLH